MTTLLSRKREQLAAAGSALEREFDHWLVVSEAGGAFEKHHSQIRRITARLTGVLGAISKERAALTDDDVLTRGAQLEQKVLAAYLIWEFFRSRIALRADDHLRPYLRACDEFAWACYKPFLDRLGIKKEPPLVFLNGGWSPFAVPRDVAFKLDRPGFAVDGEAASWLETFDFQEAIQKLPVPMLGLPWFQVNHLPDALVLGHEMGHIIETDFGLTPSLDRAIEAARGPDQRRGAWQAWQRETFADVFGTLVGGPRFGDALMDFLLTDRDTITNEKRAESNWRIYPSRWMRVAIVAETLRQTGFAAEGDRLVKAWTDEFDKPLHNQEFQDDFNPIVTAILQGPYNPIAKDGDATLTGVLSFPRDALGQAADESLANGVQGQGAVAQGRAREFIAAARVLFNRDPAEYQANSYATAICGYIEQFAPTGTRGTPPTDLQAVADADAAAGAAEGL